MRDAKAQPLTVHLAVFSCARCGLRKTARVSLPAGSPSVDETLERVACPRCEHIERPFRPVRATKLVVLGLLAAVACFIEGADGETLWWLLGVACLGVTGALFWRGLAAAALLRQASVELSDEPLPVHQIAGTTCVVCAKRIVMDSAGLACPACQATVHTKTCAQRHAAGAHAVTAGGSAYRS